MATIICVAEERDSLF